MQEILPVMQTLFNFWPALLLLSLLKKPSDALPFGKRLLRACQRIFIAWCAWLILLAILVLNQYSQARQYVLAFFGLGLLTGIPILISILNKRQQAGLAYQLQADLDSLQNMPPDQFTHLIASFFEQMGYRTWAIDGSYDHGVDVLVYDGQGEKWVVQCKRYRGTVGEPVMRDLLGTMLHERASKAFLMTTGNLSQKAREWVADKPITVYEGEGLVRLVKSTIRNQK